MSSKQDENQPFRTPVGGVRPATIFALLLLVAAASGGEKAPRAMDVWTWHDRAFDFSAVRVFDTEPLPPGTANRVARGIKTQEDEIRELVLAAFVSRGYVYDPDADAIDMILHFEYTPPEGQRPGAARTLTRGVQATLQGSISRTSGNSLYVELRHPETGQPVWRGRIKKVMRKKAADQERLRAAAQGIANAFPPEPHEAPPAEYAGENGS